MASNRNLLVLPGDGIGPEVMNEVRKIIAWMGKRRAVGFDIKEDVVGGAALDKHGVPLSDDAMKTALEADAVPVGSVGGPKKANVMHTGVLWREEATRLHKENYSDVALSHMYADALAMQLLRSPGQFDVIVTDNLFGDILSDEASMLTGSLGMLPSASLGAPDATGRRKALYEPIHGRAPDIAENGLANRLAGTPSYAMMPGDSLDP